MKQNIEQLLYQDSFKKNSNKPTKSNSMHFLLFALISLLVIFLLCKIYIHEEQINSLMKNLQLKDLNNTLMQVSTGIKEKEISINTINSDIIARKRTKNSNENLLVRFKERNTVLIANYNNKKRYKQLSFSITSFLSPNYLHLIETMSNCTFISNCYRLTRDGYSAKAFHHNCDGLKPTVTVISKKRSQAVFGGMTYESWDGNEVKYDDKAFIFSLIFMQTYPIIKGMPAISTSPNLLPTFGETDLYVDEKEAYTGIPMKSYGTRGTEDYDKRYYEIEEMEVFVMDCKLK